MSVLTPRVEAVGHPLVLGEGPHWDERSQSLYLVDIIAQKMIKYTPKTKEWNSVVLGRDCSLLIPIHDQPDFFVTAFDDTVATVKWNGKDATVDSVNIKWKTEERDSNKMNDGKCDPRGRLWAGSCPKEIDLQRPLEGQCKLSSFEKSGNITRQPQVNLSNGLAWSSDNKKFYYVDSLRFNVRSFDYDMATGNIGNEKVIFNLKAQNIQGLPDGMTIDEEDKLWVAIFGGARVIRIDPKSGELMYTLLIPAVQTTSCAFGGPKYDELYVTSANIPSLLEDEKKQHSHNGYVFKVTGLGVRGVRPVDFILE